MYLVIDCALPEALAPHGVTAVAWSRKLVGLVIYLVIHFTGLGVRLDFHSPHTIKAPKSSPLAAPAVAPAGVTKIVARINPAIVQNANIRM